MSDIIGYKGMYLILYICDRFFVLLVGMVKVVSCQLSKCNVSFLTVVKKQQSPFMQLLAAIKYYCYLIMPFIKANLSVVVFAATLFIVYYYLTLEADGCVAYAEQFDQSSQLDNYGSGNSSGRNQRSYRKMRGEAPLTFDSEVLLAGLALVFLVFICYNYNGGLFFPPDVPKKK